MKSTCIINNFNYSKFIVDAINSALQQSNRFDEVIIVDDCSTDDSVRLIKEYCKDLENVKLILKQKNEGQLSSFNAGFLKSSGDLIFFLDADDIYHQDYHKTVLEIYESYSECDFLACNCLRFSNDIENYFKQIELNNLIDEANLESSKTYKSEDYKHREHMQDLGYSILLAKYYQKYIGSETSGISMRRHILDKFLPIECTECWKTRADDVLVFGSSFVGARKFSLNLPLVGYRIHGKNSYAGNKNWADKNIFYRRQVALNQLFSILSKKNNYNENLIEIAPFEFKTIDNPNWENFFMYAQLVLNSQVYLSKKISYFLIILKHILTTLQRK